MRQARMMHNFHAMMDMAHMLQARRDFLTRAFHQKCPVCRSNQIQLIDQRMLAKWKCRECYHEFKFEPLKHELT